jgi:hypothetical protein
MMNSRRVVFLVLAALAFIYALIFPLLTIDSLVLLFSRPQAYETGNFLLILFLEVTRLFTTLVGIGVAAYLLVRASDREDGRALAIFLLFATITYEKVLGGGVIGPVQDSAARALIGGGVPAGLLKLLFGPQVWTAWFAIAALLRFSAFFPRPLHAEALAASGLEDRRGLLRGSAVAGADIGASFRALSSWLLVRKTFGPVPLAIFALLMAALHVLLADRVHDLVFWAIAIIMLFVAITNVRGAYLVSDDDGRSRTAWITLGLVLGLFMFLTSTAAYVLIPTTLTRAMAFGLMMITPAVIMSCLALSVGASSAHDTRAAVDWAVRAGTIILGMMIVLAAALALARWTSSSFGVPPALAILGAVALTALAYVPVSRGADRTRRRVLEDAGNDDAD